MAAFRDLEHHPPGPRLQLLVAAAHRFRIGQFPGMHIHEQVDFLGKRLQPANSALRHPIGQSAQHVVSFRGCDHARRTVQHRMSAAQQSFISLDLAIRSRHDRLQRQRQNVAGKTLFQVTALHPENVAAGAYAQLLQACASGNRLIDRLEDGLTGKGLFHYAGNLAAVDRVHH